MSVYINMFNHKWDEKTANKEFHALCPPQKTFRLGDEVWTSMLHYDEELLMSTNKHEKHALLQADDIVC